MTRLLLLSGAAAAFSLVVGSERFGKRKTVLAGFALALLLALPISAKTPAEAFFPTLASITAAAVMIAAAVKLLGKDPLAWLYFGLLGFVAKGAVLLLEQSVPADRAEGLAALALAALLSLLLAAAGRQRPSTVESGSPLD